MLEILKKYPSTHFLLNFTETDFTNQMLQTIYEAELIFKRFQQMERLILMFICLMLSLE